MSSGVARPILIRPATTSLARFMPSARRASSTSTIAVGMPERACAVAIPAPIRPAPDDADAIDRPGRDAGVGRRPGRVPGGCS